MTEIYVIEIPHQLPPKLAPFSERMLSGEPVTFQVYKSEEELAYGYEEGIPAKALQILRQHGAVVLAGIRDGIEWQAPSEADEFALRCESAFGDNHWYAIGTLEELLKRLPNHQRLKATTLIEGEMS
jgi:hypothetical protein